MTSGRHVVIVATLLGMVLLVHQTTGEIREKGWWKHEVFYQVYPRSFMDADNDGIGDLRGIEQRLQHFKDTGIRAIWLSPIYASPMVDFGYDISDFRDIHEEFGTMEDFESLMRKAKELGIKLIMDLVPNHTSDQHEWFIKSYKGIGKYKYYYMWHPGKNNGGDPPNNWISVFSGPAWTYNSTRGLYYFHQFEYRQPDLNYTNPNVRQEMEEIITFWLNKGVDGFRIDAIPHIYEVDSLPDEPRTNNPAATPHDYTYLDHIYTKDDPRTYDLVASWRKLIDEWTDRHNETERVLLTEAYADIDNTTKYYRFGANIPMNFFFIVGANNKSSATDFKRIIDDWMARVPPGESGNWVMGNHDRSRTPTRYPGRADQMTMLTMVLPGVGVTYYGEEIAMEDKLDISWEDTQDPQACNTQDPEHFQSRSRDPNRTPMQWDDTQNAGFSRAEKTWLPVHSNYKTLNLRAQQSQSRSHYNLYKTLVTYRKEHLSSPDVGLTTKVLNNDKVLTIVRNGNGESTILLINFMDDQSTEVNLSDLVSEGRDAKVVVANVESTVGWGSAVSDISKVPLQAKASIVLTIKTSGSGSNSGTFSISPMNVLITLAFVFAAVKLL